MLPKSNLSFDAQKAALANVATGPAGDTFAQALASAQALMGGATQQLRSLGPSGVTQMTADEFAQGIADYGKANPAPERAQQVTPTQGNAAVPEGDIEQYIYRGLLDRGFTDIQARGSILNFKDESGLVANIVEGAPNKHGTRGQGLYRLTDIAPGKGRRTDYLNYMSGLGRDDVWSIDSQLDFYKWETENTEKGSWAKFANAPSVGQFGAGMATHFLRPAEEHLRKRVANYLTLG